MGSSTKAPARETLAEFVRRVRTKNKMSLADVELQSGRYGPKIAASYVNRIENDLKTNLSADRLIALARGLGVPEEQLFAVNSGKSISDPSSVEARLLDKFRELPPARQNDVIKIIDALHLEHGEPAAQVKPVAKPRRFNPCRGYHFSLAVCPFVCPNVKY